MMSGPKHLWVYVLLATGSVNFVLSDCNLGSMDAYTVTSSSVKNLYKAADAFTEKGWCASKDVSGEWLEVDFTNGFGAKRFTVGSTAEDSTSYPSSVLVQYVPNFGTDLTNFTMPNSQPLIINLNNTGTSSVELSVGFSVKKLRFTLKGFKGSACMTLNVSGCTLNNLCSNPCQNGGLCVLEDYCQCQGGFQGKTCEMKPCTPEVLGLHDGRIPQNNVLVSSEDSSFPKSQIGFNTSDPSFNTGWCAADNDLAPWIQIHFDEIKSISTFAFYYINGKDALRTYMRQFELQYIAPTDSARVFRTYATSIDSLNGTHAIQIDLLPPLITDTVRLVSTSVEGKACFKLELKGCDPRGLCQAGWCKNGGSCVGKDICKCQTGFIGDRCDKTKDDINTPRIAFLNITNNILLTTSFTFSVTGSVHIQHVNKENIIVISGINSNIKLAQGTVGAECYHDIDTCKTGFTLALEVKFGSLLNNTYIVSSGGNIPNHRGLALYYNQQQLTYIVTTSTQTWILTVPYVPVLQVWQKFEITWSANLGIGLYLNEKLLGTHSRPQPTTASMTGDLCIGCNPGQVSQVLIDMQIKEIHTWTVTRTELVNVGIVRAPIVTTRLPVQSSTKSATSTAPKTQPTTTLVPVTTKLTTKVTTSRPSATSITTKSTTPNHGYEVYNMTLTKIVGSLLITPTFNFTVHGNPKLELQNNSQTALILDCSKSQYVELLDRGIPCLQDLDNCQKGFTFRLEALFTKIDLQEKTYILSSGGDQNVYNGMALYLHSNLLTYGVKKGNQHWASSTNIQNIIQTDTWYVFEISWMEQTGLLVLIDGFEVIKEKDWTPSPGRSHSNPVLIGKSTDNNYTSCMKVRNLYTWTAQREILVTSGVLPEPRPPTITMTTPIDLLTLTYYDLTFLKIDDHQIVYTSSFIFQGHGDPKLPPNGDSVLSLNGNNDQYLTLLNRSVICLDLITTCKNGFSLEISVFVIQKAENEIMYFFSSVNNNTAGGVYFYYENGQLYYGFRFGYKSWSGSVKYNIVDYQWHSFILSWSEADGISLFENLKLLSHSIEPFLSSVNVNVTGEFKIGRGDLPQKSIIQVNNLKLWPYSMTVLIDQTIYSTKHVSTTSTNRPSSLTTLANTDVAFTYFKVLGKVGNVIITSFYNITTHGSVEIEPSHGDEQVIKMDISKGGYLDIDASNFVCINEFQKCGNGMTVTLTVRFIQINTTTKLYLLSKPPVHGGVSISLYYQTKELFFEVIQVDELRKWSASCPFQIESSHWNALQLMWSAKSGVLLLNNGILLKVQTVYRSLPYLDLQTGTSLTIGTASTSLPGVILYVQDIGIGPVNASWFPLLSTWTMKSPKSTLPFTSSQFSKSSDRIATSPVPHTTIPSTSHVTRTLDTTHKAYTKETTTGTIPAIHFNINYFVNISITGNTVYTSNLVMVSYGAIELYKGDKGQNILQVSNSNGSFLEIKLNHTSCLNSNQLCEHGVSVLVNLSFIQVPTNKITYVISNLEADSDGVGFYLYYFQNRIYFGFRSNNITWSTNFEYILQLHKWHTYKLSFTKEHGAALFIDDQLFKFVTEQTSTHYFPHSFVQGVTIGSVGNSSSPVIFQLSGVEFLPSVELRYEAFTPERILFPTIKRNTTTNSIISLHGNIEVITVSPTKNVVQIDTSTISYIEVNSTGIKCVHSLSQCPRGFTVELDVDIISVSNQLSQLRLYFFTNERQGGSFYLYYLNKSIHFGVIYGSSTWASSLKYDIKLDVWNTYTLSWSHKFGCALYINNHLVRKASNSHHIQEQSKDGRFLIGKSNGTESVIFLVSGLRIWSMSYDILVQYGIKNNNTLLQTTPVSVISSLEQSLAPSTTQETKSDISTQMHNTTDSSSETPGIPNFAFVNITGNILYTDGQLFTVHGKPEIVIDKQINKQVVLLRAASNAYIEMDHKNLTCLNSESKCKGGFTVGVIMNVVEIEQSQTLYILSSFVNSLSGTSFFVYYFNTTINFGFKFTNTVISTSVWYHLVPNTWHTVEISVSYSNDSIGLIIDNRLIKLVTKETSTNQYPMVQNGGLTIGHVTHNDIATTVLIGGIQFLQKVSPVLVQVFSVPGSFTSAKTTPKPEPTTAAPTSPGTSSTTSRTTTKSTTTSTTTKSTTKSTTTSTTTKSTSPTTTEPPIPTFHWNLSSVPSTNVIIGLKYNLTIHGTPMTVPGGLDLKNSTQYIDLGGIKCLLNPVTCSQGLTIQFKINVKAIQENTFLLTSGGQLPDGVGIAVLYRYGQYQFVVSTATQSWYAYCGKDVLTPEKFHAIMLTWHLTIGLEIIIDNKQVQMVNVPITHEASTITTTAVYVGKQTSTTIKYEYIIQTMTIWYAHVDVLVLVGLCEKPDRPGKQTTPVITRSVPTKKVSTSPFTGIVTTKAPQCPAGCVSVAKTTSKPGVTATSKHPDSGSDKSTPVSATSKHPPVKTETPTTVKTTASTTPTTTERAAPNYHTDVTITATYSTTDKEAFLVCAYVRPSEAGIEMTVALLIEDKRVLVQTVPGEAGVAAFAVSQVNRDLYKKKIQCSLVANYVGSSHSTQVFVSNTYIPDFTVKPAAITVTEGRPGKYVTIHSTAPPQLYCCTGCKGQCQVHVVGTFVLNRKDARCNNNFISQAVIESTKPPNHNREICGFALTNRNWNSDNTILVTATLDNQRDGTQKRELKIVVNVYNQPPTAQITEKPVAHILSPHVQVTILDNYHSPYTCKSVNDPHMLTFDGAHFNNMNEGQFVMFRHTELPFEVRSWYYKCSSRSHATCNCGVAIKSGDDVISVIGCHTVTSHGHPGHGHGIGLILQQLFGSHGHAHGHDKDQFAKAPMMIQIYKNGELTPGTFIRRYGCGQKYEIQLPTGMIITVQQSYKPFINIWIKASSSDRGKSTGLCGNFNGAKDEWKNGNRGIAAFIQQHKAPTDNFFNGVGVSTLVTGSKFCSCIEGKGSVCSPGLGYMQCTRSKYDITAALLRQAKSPILTVSRQKRQVTTTDMAPTVIPDGSNMTRDEAADECREAILNNTVTNYCRPILTTNLTQQIENCAEDYLATGSFVWAKSALSDIAVDCVERASALLANNDTEGDTNNTSVDLPDNLDEILSKACVDDCGINGECQGGVCVCKDGYTGVTCEISRNTKPVVSSVPYLCDVSATVDCMGAVVYGDNFVNSSTLTCHFEYIEVSETVQVTQQTETVMAQFMSLNQVMCLLPRLQSARIKISNDGQTLSDRASPHVVFDSGCYMCIIQNATNGYIPVCTRLENNCVINGLCYQPGQNKPGDSCKNCNPTINDTEWSDNREKAECTAQPVVMAASKTEDNEKKVIALAVVSAVLAAILLVLIVHIVKTRSNSKAESGEYQVQPQEKVYQEDAFHANPIYDQESEKL